MTDVNTELNRNVNTELNTELNTDSTASATQKTSDLENLYVSWDDYHHKVEQLAVQVYQSNWSFNQIICLAKGGLRVGDILARIYDVPLAVLATSSYRGDGGRDRGTLVFSDDLTKTTQHLGSHILLVDDLVDSGITLQKTLPWLDRKYGFYIEEVRTAVIWYKACSVIKPDYYVDYLEHNPWIHQPFERYEDMKPADLAAQHSGQMAASIQYPTVPSGGCAG